MRVILPETARRPGPTLAEKTEFAQEVERYAEDLTRWLGEYETMREIKSRQFKVTFRVENEGEAPAENVRLRIRLPDDFEEVATQPSIAGPPARPSYEPPGPGGIRVNRQDFSLLRQALSSGSSSPREREFPSRPTSTCSYDGEHLLLTYDLGALNHGPDHMQTHPCDIRVPAPGSYEGQWEVLAANGTAKGPLRIVVPPPGEGPALATLDEVTEETERLGLFE